MSNTLTAEQKQFVGTVREITQGEFKGRGIQWMDGTFPWVNMRRLAEVGVLGMAVPEEYGGLGLPVNGQVPGSLFSSGMQRTVTDRSSLIFFSSSTSPLKCVSAKPPWIGVGLPSSSRSVVKNA